MIGSGVAPSPRAPPSEASLSINEPASGSAEYGEKRSLFPNMYNPKPRPEYGEK
jgi:hypothetical protein